MITGGDILYMFVFLGLIVYFTKRKDDSLIRKGYPGFIEYTGYAQPNIFKKNETSWIYNHDTYESFLAVVKERNNEEDLKVKVIIYRGEFDS